MIRFRFYSDDEDFEDDFGLDCEDDEDDED